MKALKCELIKTDGNQRFYRLNQDIETGYMRLTGRNVNIRAELADAKEKRFKDEYKKFVPETCNIVCISDAHTHNERLVFVGMEYEKDGNIIHSRTPVQIEGCHTMMIHGGDSTSMKDDMVYIRLLARHNGFRFIN